MNRLKQISMMFTLGAGVLQGLGACTNINQKISGLLNTTNTNLVTRNAAFSHTLSSINQGAATDSPSVPSTSITLFADTSKAGYQPLTGFCGINGTNPCVCEMVWTQLSTVNNTSYNYSRTKRTPVIQVASGSVQCDVEQSIWDEIPDQTIIAFRIVPVTPTNTTGLNTTTLNWKKGATASAGADFSDDTGTPFQNILRYTCYSKNPAPRAYEITSQFTNASSSGTTTTTIPIMMGSRYCTSNGVGSGGGTSNCPAPRSGYTAQSYYRNFYVRTDTLGQINSTNDTYDCPQVLESIKYSAGQTIPTSENNKYWPLDSSFALATANNSEWSVGVSATSNVFKSNDVNSTPSICAGETSAAASHVADGKTVIKCLGYAKPPNTNGTCGTIKDSSGKIHPLTRLRRFRVIYPPMYDSNGKILDAAPFADEVYIADRLVVDSSGNATGNMIYGPKPCNFAWFDHEGVTTRDGSVNFFSGLRGDYVAAFGANGYATPGYVATSNYSYIENRDYPADPLHGAHQWSVDPDGLVLPNVDRSGSTTNAQNYASCSATLPWIDWNNGTPSDLRLITTNEFRTDSVTLGARSISLREIHPSSVDPWTPNYVEDTSFAGCVPNPTVFLEPPLHFYQKDSNTMAWCANVYPTQNPYWYDLNKFRKPQSGSALPTANDANFPAAAPVKIYTSHITGGTTSTALDSYNACTGTLPAVVCPMTGYLSGGTLANCMTYLARTAGQSATCDRTVEYNSAQAFLGFPLAAKDDDINQMLSDDLNHNKTFGCQYSVNVDASAVGTKTPSSGCCGYTGGVKLLHNLTNGNGAHLEPFKDPAATDDSRFCGWPVQ